MANDFASDVHCIALYNFESGALATDSKGTNTLSLVDGGPAEDTTNYKQGLCSADFPSNKAMYRNDADWSARYPLKEGVTNQKFSICSWFRIHTINDYAAIFMKYEVGWTKKCIVPLRVSTTGPSWNSIISPDGSADENLYWSAGSPAPLVDRWYHFGFTLDNSNKAWKLVIWDDVAGSKVVDTSGTATNFMATPADNATYINVGYTWFDSLFNYGDWNIDELAIFDDILTADEIDAIRGGTYSVGVAGGNFWPVLLHLMDES